MNKRMIFTAVLIASTALAGDWTEPKDGVLTAKQIDTFLDFSERAVALYYKHMDKLAELEKKKAGMAEHVAAGKEFEEDNKKNEAATKMSPAELEWVKKTTNDTYLQLWARRELEKQKATDLKATDEKIAGCKKTLADLEASKKAGKRPMTSEQRAEAKTAAEAEVAEAKKNAESTATRVKEAKEAVTEAKKALAAAEGDAKNDAQSNLDGATNALKEAQAADDEAKALVARAEAKAKNPDVPSTPEEKEALGRELDEQIAAAKTELETSQKLREEQAKVFQNALAEMDKQLEAFPAKNRELVGARLDRMEKIFKSLFAKDKK